jgi:hypothetical protein
MRERHEDRVLVPVDAEQVMQNSPRGSTDLWEPSRDRLGHRTLLFAVIVGDLTFGY